jgi:hypothetical protein
MMAEFTLLFDREHAAEFAAQAEMLQRDLGIAARVERSGTIYAGEARAMLRALRAVENVLNEGLRNLDSDATPSGKGGD